MGVFNSIDLVLQNEFPDNNNHAELLNEFYAWLDNEEKNMIFVYSDKPGILLDLCNSEAISISSCLEYWC